MNDKSIIVVDQSMNILPDGREIPHVSPETEIREQEGELWVYYYDEPHCSVGSKKALENYWVHKEPGYQVGRCKMVLRGGERCRNGCRPGWKVCHKHGAGGPSRPGGMSDYHMKQLGRHMAALPTGLAEKYSEFLNDPDTVSMASEMALLDTRIDQCIERLETADTEVAWAKVKQARRRVEKDEVTDKDLDFIFEMLDEAVDAKQNDMKLWGEITKLIEQRRKLSETEQRRIVAAKQMMTVEEANRLLAFLMNSINKHVDDPLIKRRIADDLREIM